MEQMTSICDMVGQYMQKKEEDKRIAEDQAAKDQYCKIPICYNDDDDEYSFATQEYIKKFSSTITPDLLKSDSLIMKDEHLDTISETESDKLIKSSVEDLVHTPSESDGISEGECDLTVYDDFSPKKDEIQRISLTGFPAQSVGSSNTDVLDLPCLLVLITGTSQSRQHVDTSLIHIESRKSPTAVLFDDDTGRISIRHCEY
ncbi:hypothetical protein Tco_0117277 [Tanacetum coccineum]